MGKKKSKSLVSPPPPPQKKKKKSGKVLSDRPTQPLKKRDFGVGVGDENKAIQNPVLFDLPCTTFPLSISRRRNQMCTSFTGEDKKYSHWPLNSIPCCSEKGFIIIIIVVVIIIIIIIMKYLLSPNL